MLHSFRATSAGVLALVLVFTSAFQTSAVEPDPGLELGVETEVALPNGATADFNVTDPAAAGAVVEVTALDVTGQTASTDGDVVAALTGGIEITATSVAGTDIESFAHAVTIEPATSDTPGYVKEFTAGIELTFPVDAALVATIDPATLSVYSRENPDDPWTLVPSVYDPDLGAVVAQSDHLSEFTVMGAPASAPGLTADGKRLPRIALDPDDNVGHALWDGATLSELDYSYLVATMVRDKLETECKAEVLITRDASTDFVSRNTRAGKVALHDTDIALTLAFNALDGTPWGWEGDGGVEAWASGDPASVAFGNRFLARVPEYTGRPNRKPLNTSHSVLPYDEFAGTADVYAHAELLFLDHNYDWVVIRDHLSTVADAVFVSIIDQINATPDIACGQEVTLPAPPSAEDLEKWRQLGYNNFQMYGADPVNLATGNFVASEPVFTLTGVGDQVMDLTLAYNALDGRMSQVGSGWNFAFSSRAQLYDNGAVLVTLADGRSDYFEPDGNGGFVAPPGANSILTSKEGGAVLSTGRGAAFEFSFDPYSGLGTLTRTTDRQGNAFTFTYGEAAPAPVDALTFAPLTAITDEAGQTVAVQSTPNGRIKGFTHPDGRQWTLDYDTAGHLTELTDGAGRIRTFSYTADGLLETVTGADDVVELTNFYDADLRVVKQVDGMGTERRMSYTLEGVTTLVDALGNTSVLEHNDKGQLVAERDPEGGVTRTLYDENANPVTSIDANGNKSSSTFDDFGRVLSFTNAIGESTTYTYTTRGDLTSITGVAPNGETATTLFVLNDDGRAVETHLPDGSVTRASYDEHGDVTAITDANGNTTSFGYDARGNTTTETDPLGGTTTTVYDLANRPISATDALGGTTTFEWDSADNLLSIADPLGNSASNSYRADGLLLAEGDFGGWVTIYEYNANQQVISADRGDGDFITYSYDAEHRLIRMTHEDGTHQRYEYDKLGRQTAVVDENGERWLTEYDAVGNAIATVDPLGNRTAVEYDALSQAVSVADALGNTSHASYAPGGQIATTTDALGRITTNTYDIAGRLVAVSMPDGSTASFGYDPNGNMTLSTDARGFATRFTFDALDRQTKVTDALNGEWITEYDALGRPTATVDPLGARTEITYDAVGNALVVEDAAGGVVTTVYDPMGRPRSITDQVGRETHPSFDSEGRLLTTDDLAQFVFDWTYDSRGNVIQAHDFEGGDTYFTYDGVGRQVSKVNSMGATSFMEYDAAGRLVAKVDVLGNRSTVEYDALSKPVKTTDALGGVTVTTYDAVGNAIAVKDARGFTTSFAYDALDRPVSVTTPDGHTAIIGYDAQGNVTRTIDARGYATTTEYDALGRPTATTDALAGLTQVEYDAVGNLTSVVDPMGGRTTTTYDLLSRPVSVKNAMNGVRHTSYDPLGRVTSTTDELGRITEVGYREWDGRLDSVTAPDGGVTRYHYTGGGFLAVALDPEGRAVQRRFDLLGQETSLTDAGGNVWSTEYDAIGNVTATVDPSGARTSIEYDALSRPIMITNALGDPAMRTYDALGAVLSETDALNRTTRYTYDVMGQRASSQTPQGAITQYTYDANGNEISTTDALGFTSRSEFDALNRKVAVQAPDGGRTVATFDANGRPIAVRDALGNNRTIEYDLLGRAVRSVDAGGYANTTSYDAVGNPVESVSARGGVTSTQYDAMNRPVASVDATGAETSASYDLVGNLSETMDAAGTVTRYSYDARDLLIQTIENVQDGVTPSESANVTTTAAYDSRGRMIASTDPNGNSTLYVVDALGRIETHIDPLGGATTTLYDAAGQVAKVIAPDGSETVSTYTLDGLLARVAYPDQVVSFAYDAKGNQTGMTDQLGNSTWVLDWAGRPVSDTDANGNKTLRTFDLAGNETRVQYADGRTVQRTFDRRGLAIAQREINMSFSLGTTAFGYDADGAMVRTVRPSGVVSVLERDLMGRVTNLVHSRSITNAVGAVVSIPGHNGAGNAFGDCKADGSMNAARGASGKCAAVESLSLEYTYDGRGLVTDRKISTTVTPAKTSKDAPSPFVTETVYVHDALGRLTSSQMGEVRSEYRWDAASNLVWESISDDLTTKVLQDGAVTERYVNGANQLTSTVEDPMRKSVAHTLTTVFQYDARGNRVSESATRVTDDGVQAVSGTAWGFDARDQLVSKEVTEKSRRSETTLWVRDGLGRALEVVEDEETRLRVFDGLEVVVDGATVITRDPLGGVLTETSTTVKREGGKSIASEVRLDLLTDLLGTPIAVAQAGSISGVVQPPNDFGEALKDPGWATVTGFTGRTVVAAVVEFRSRTYDPTTSIWLSDDRHAGTLMDSTSLNRYAYVQGAPESFVDIGGYKRAAPAVNSQTNAASGAADKSAQAGMDQAAPPCTGYYGCSDETTQDPKGPGAPLPDEGDARNVIGNGPGAPPRFPKIPATIGVACDGSTYKECADDLLTSLRDQGTKPGWLPSEAATRVAEDAAVEYGLSHGGHLYYNLPICGVYAICIVGVSDTGVDDNAMVTGRVVLYDKDTMGTLHQFHEYAHVRDQVQIGHPRFMRDYITEAAFAIHKNLPAHDGNLMEKWAQDRGEVANALYLHEKDFMSAFEETIYDAGYGPPSVFDWASIDRHINDRRLQDLAYPGLNTE